MGRAKPQTTLSTNQLKASSRLTLGFFYGNFVLRYAKNSEKC
jgi:hypothetical protein